MTLLTLASRQIWPQVLGFLHLQPRPERLVLLHTVAQDESQGPAERLKRLIVQQAWLSEERIELVPIPHDGFSDVVDAIASVAERLELDDSNCRLHFTGGNKLMAMAAVEWCRLSDIPCFYLERDARVFPFLPRSRELLPTEPYQVDLHLAREIPPLPLLQCQLGEAEVVAPGQLLTLNPKGRNLPDGEIGPLLARNEDFLKFLQWDHAEPESNPGFNLEYATAVALLKLGVPMVQRSVRLAARTLRGAGKEIGELDLVFNWAGKLWVVDCKDRHDAEFRVEHLRTEILRQLNPPERLTQMLDRLEDELRHRDLHPLKEDLLAVSEVGGLLGKAICVRREPLPIQAAEFCQSRHLAVVMKGNLILGLRGVLHPKDSRALLPLRSQAGG